MTRTRIVVCRLSAVGLLALIPACQSDDGIRREGSSAELQDENVTVFDGPPEVVEISDDPVFTFLGSDNGPTSPLFRITDILPRDDGGLFIANSGASEVISLTADGGVEWVFGRSGNGPGEFTRLSGLQAWRADSLAVLDTRHARVTYISRSGQFGRTAAVTPPVPDPSPNLGVTVSAILIGVLDDGRLVFHGPETVDRLGEPGPRRVRTPITLVDPELGTQQVLVELPGPWMYELKTPDFMPVILTPMSIGESVAVERDGVVGWRADSFEVFTLDGQGVSGRTARIDEPLDRVTAQMRAAYLEQWSPQFPVEEDIPFVTTEVPSFNGIFRSTNGDIWARRYDPQAQFDTEIRERWIRFPSDGSVPVEYRFPARVRILAASSGVAYGVARDALDVERIAGFRLE